MMTKQPFIDHNIITVTKTTSRLFYQTDYRSFGTMEVVENAEIMVYKKNSLFEENIKPVATNYSKTKRKRMWKT